jgi:hypothetical protein
MEFSTKNIEKVEFQENPPSVFFVYKNATYKIKNILTVFTM